MEINNLEIYESKMVALKKKKAMIWGKATRYHPHRLPYTQVFTFYQSSIKSEQVRVR